MLRSVTEIEKYTIGATDGTIGSVKDCYFDDEGWAVRYLVVKTGAWLVGREVLISPLSIRDSDTAENILHVSISKDQVKNSPSIDTQQPVSRQQEMGYSSYYAYPYYWGGGGLWGGGVHPSAMLTGSNINDAQARERDDEASYSREARRHANDDHQLRSCEAVRGYRIHAADGDIGHVDGFLVDKRTWAIRYLIVNTSNWWLGHQVLIAPSWLKDVSWAYSKVTTSFTRQEVKDAPAYDSRVAPSRVDEEGIYRHYQREGYWREKNGREAA